jgi:hypothetical protein
LGAGDGGRESEGAVGGSDADAGSEEEPELMDASELAGELHLVTDYYSVLRECAGMCCFVEVVL